MSKISLLNIRGLIPKTVASKVPYIGNLLLDEGQLAFALTETWLTADHNDAECYIPGYTLYRQDRKRQRSGRGRNSGGVALYLKDQYASSTENIFNFSSGVIEALGIHIPTLNTVIIVVYRQPDDTVNANRSTSREFKCLIRELKACLDDLPSPVPSTIVLGDFNLPHATWDPPSWSAGTPADERRMIEDLRDLTLDNFLTQQVESPTHRDGNILDIIFTNDSRLVHDICILPSKVSDHLIVEMTTAIRPNQHAADINVIPDNVDKTETKDDFRHLNFYSEDTNWDAISLKLSQYNWAFELQGLNADNMLSKFISVCLSISREFTPLKKNAPGSPPKKRSIIPRHRRILMRKRSRLKAQLLRANTEARQNSITRSLIEIEIQIQDSLKQQSEFEEQKAVESIKKNPKYFFTYAKKFSKIKFGIGPFTDAANKIIDCPMKMAEILSKQYQSVFSQPLHCNNSPHHLFPDEPPSEVTINLITFSDNELEKAMKDLPSNAAAGPDGFPAILLKKCCSILSSPLATIWRQSLVEGIVPGICKHALIIPVHKGKSRSLPQNYRPIALTSHLVKVFEKVVRCNLVRFMEQHKLFNNSQHGFRGGRSCLSQLLNHIDRITSLLEDGNDVDVIYLDFAKAFDKVDIGVTLRKLKSLGIRGQLGRWLASFLLDRQQAVVVDGQRSPSRPVLSGVPQGSVLGPFLFLVLIGDIDAGIVSSFLSSFADDTRISHPITEEEDSQQLQADLEKVYKWAKDNNMQFNSEKFELLKYRANNQNQGLPHPATYKSSSGTVIDEKDHISDLGIHLSSDATFKYHIDKKISAMKSKVSWILRTFKTRANIPMLTLWKQLVLSEHDYCCQIWSPTKAGETQALEAVQKSFVRKIDGTQGMSYWEQLKNLKLYSLQRRRERYIIIYLWRILEGQVPNLESTPILSQQHQRRGRECLVPMVSNATSSLVRQARYASFAIRGPKLFNCLPQTIRNISGCDVESFKRALDRFLSGIPDEPPVHGYTQYRRCETNSLVDWCVSAQLRQLEDTAS